MAAKYHLRREIEALRMELSAERVLRKIDHEENWLSYARLRDSMRVKNVFMQGKEENVLIALPVIRLDESLDGVVVVVGGISK